MDNLTSIDNDSIHNGFKTSTYSITQTVILGTIAILLSLITVIGNIMVMISFKMDKQLQTISNYFLFSLAVADFAIGLISMPLFTVYTLMGYWPLSPFICDTWLALDYLASNASVLNLLIISFDRYFSVTRPLTYRVKRTTSKAAYMIAAAWGISLLLWTPWIYSWPYIEGKRTVPRNECYIQFIETNHYITFGTAIAAFYIPVSVMIYLYWCIWKETEKRQKDLPNLQAFQNRVTRKSVSRNSLNNSDRINDLNSPDESITHRQKSEHSINLSTRIDIDSDEFDDRKEFKWKWKCLQHFWICCPPSWLPTNKNKGNIEIDSGLHSDQIISCEYLTPTSEETVGCMNTLGGNSLNILKNGFGQNNNDHDPEQNRFLTPPCSSKNSAMKLSSSTDSLYTILIQLPAEKEAITNRTQTGPTSPIIQPVIKMISEKSKCEKRNVNYSAIDNKQQQSETTFSQLPLNSKGYTVQRERHYDGDRDKMPKKGPEKKADRKAAKTLSAILLTFIITWTPYNVLVLLKPFTSVTIPTHLWDFFYYLCYINSTINPVCYALCNAAFRKTYIRILTCKWKNRIRVAINRGLFNH